MMVMITEIAVQIVMGVAMIRNKKQRTRTLKKQVRNIQSLQEGTKL